MDAVDQVILEKLKTNCRTSLQELSKISDLSANAVKKRIDNLASSGVIKDFVVILSPLMTNEDTVIAVLEFEGEQNENSVLKNIGKNPAVHRASRLLDGRYIIFGIYFDSEELSSLTMHLRQLQGVRNIEMHSRFINYWGGKIDFTHSHKEILRCLIQEPRMSISDIASKTGLLSNDVKEIIEQMRASESVLFTISTSEAADKRRTEVVAKIQWNVGKTSKELVLDWLQDQFSELRLVEYVSATEPTLFFQFSINHVQEVDLIVRRSLESGPVTTIEPMILFPGTTYPDPRKRRAKMLLEETGFSLS